MLVGIREPQFENHGSRSLSACSRRPILQVMLVMGMSELDTDKYLKCWLTVSRHSRTRRRVASVGASCHILTATTKQSLLILGMMFLCISFQFIYIHPYSHLVSFYSFCPLSNPRRFRFGACARIHSWIPDMQREASCFCTPLQRSERSPKQWSAIYMPSGVCVRLYYTSL